MGSLQSLEVNLLRGQTNVIQWLLLLQQTLLLTTNPVDLFVFVVLLVLLSLLKLIVLCDFFFI
jgi:hypothetical protein